MLYIKYFFFISLLRIKLNGKHQKNNATLMLFMISNGKIKLKFQNVIKGISVAHLIGRSQVIFKNNLF